MRFQGVAHVEAHAADEGVNDDGPDQRFPGGDFRGDVGKPDGAGHGHDLRDQQGQDHAHGAQAQHRAVGCGNGNDGGLVGHSICFINIFDSNEIKYANICRNVESGPDGYNVGGIAGKVGNTTVWSASDCLEVLNVNNNIVDNCNVSILGGHVHQEVLHQLKILEILHLLEIK